MTGSELTSGSLATIVAGVLGLLGGFFSRTGKYWLKKRERRTKVRRSLLAEIQTTKGTIEAAAEIKDFCEFDPVHTVIPTETYDNQANDIGLLSSHEIGPIVEYYSVAQVGKQQLNEINEDKKKRAFVNETAPSLKSTRNEAEKMLKKHDRMFGGIRYKLSRLLSCT